MYLDGQILACVFRAFNFCNRYTMNFLILLRDCPLREGGSSVGDSVTKFNSGSYFVSYKTQLHLGKGKVHCWKV